MTMKPDDLELELRRPPIVFFVQGNPRPQPRTKARIFKMGSVVKVQVYDPGTAADWKKRVWDEAWKVRPVPRLEGPCRVALRFTFARPQTLCRLRDPLTQFPHGRKPDVDNLCKLILDVLTQQGWWRDDGVVAELQAFKFWNVKNSQTFGVSVLVTEEMKDG